MVTRVELFLLTGRLRRIHPVRLSPGVDSSSFHTAVEEQDTEGKVILALSVASVAGRHGHWDGREILWEAPFPLCAL